MSDTIINRVISGVAILLVVTIGSGLSYGQNTDQAIIADNAEAEKTDYETERWRMVEISLKSSATYEDPFNDVKVRAIFTGPDGSVIKRPAFWDGNNTWKIRFAPIQTGQWHMETICSDTANQALHHIKKTISAKPYTGDLAIYRHGFLKVSPDNRYFTYADGTPFFYLGDTHWIFAHERFDTSNVEGVSSQFKYTLDKRVKQGFTVYQSEPIQPAHLSGSDSDTGGDEEAFYNLRDGFDSDDLPGFANLDRKFKYIADNGLVHANAVICWALDPANFPDQFSKAYMAKLAEYWVARYGAYPVLWTMAQEIDNNHYDEFDSVTIEKWFAAAETISDTDSYNHPLTAHMENAGETIASNSWWGDKPYHDWWAVQWQKKLTDKSIPKDFWNYTPTKPSVLFETAYEGFWTDAKGAREAGYIAFQNGLYGYGYGANGIWNDLYSQTPPDYGTNYQLPKRYLHWFKGANLKGASQLCYFKRFYTGLKWWKLIPRFDDRSWAVFANAEKSLLSSDGSSTTVVYFFGKQLQTGTLKKLGTGNVYKARWYNPRTGGYRTIEQFTAESEHWEIPAKPDKEDWMLLVQKQP